MTDPAETTNLETDAPIDTPAEVSDAVDAPEVSEQEQAVDAALDSMIDADDSVGDLDDDDPGDSIEDADADLDDDADEVVADDPTENEQWDDAKAALIANGLSEEEIDELPAAVALKMGLARIEKAEPTEETATEEAPTAFDSEAAIEAVSEILNKDFDSSESSAIASAMAKLVEFMPQSSAPSGGAEETTALRNAIAALEDMVEPVLLDRSFGKIADAFPQLEDDSSRDQVVEAAKQLVESGYKATGYDDLIETAAIKVFGRDQAKAIKAHQGKLNKAKRNGTPKTRGGRASDGDIDPIETELDRIINESM